MLFVFRRILSHNILWVICFGISHVILTPLLHANNEQNTVMINLFAPANVDNIDKVTENLKFAFIYYIYFLLFFFVEQSEFK